MNKEKFVKTFLPAMQMAYPNLKDMVYMLGSDIPEGMRPHRDIQVLLDDDEYVIITMMNDHKYYINVSCDSLQGILNDIVKAMAYK